VRPKGFPTTIVDPRQGVKGGQGRESERTAERKGERAGKRERENRREERREGRKERAGGVESRCVGISDCRNNVV